MVGIGKIAEIKQLVEDASDYEKSREIGCTLLGAECRHSILRYLREAKTRVFFNLQSCESGVVVTISVFGGQRN